MTFTNFQVLYHKHITKTDEEKRAIRIAREKRQKEKEKRRLEQARNIRKKEEEKQRLKKKALEGMKHKRPTFSEQKK